MRTDKMRRNLLSSSEFIRADQCYPWIKNPESNSIEREEITGRLGEQPKHRCDEQTQLEIPLSITLTHKSN